MGPKSGGRSMGGPKIGCKGMGVLRVGEGVCGS